MIDMSVESKHRSVVLPPDCTCLWLAKAKTSSTTSSMQNHRTIAVAISLFLLLALSGDVELNPGSKSGKLVLLTMYNLYKNCHALNYC